MTYSFAVYTDQKDDLMAWIYFNGNKLQESFHYTFSGTGTNRETGSREVTLAAKVGNTIDLRTGTMQNWFHTIYFCVAFEHGPEQQSRLSVGDEDIYSPDQYRDSAGDDDKPRSDYQDKFFAGDEEYFSPDLKNPQSSCSSNADCPPHLACIRLAVTESSKICT